MLILVGASASGKTEVLNYLTINYGLKKMVTYTTRKPRVNEIDGVSYNFVTIDEFKRLMDNNEFLETVCYNGNYYGTRKSDMADDKVVILEPNGLKSFTTEMKNKVTSIYLNVSEKTRIERMSKRGDYETEIKRRIVNDRIAFANVENVDYVLENENITGDMYKDGGSMIYQYDTYTIIKCHTIDGNRDVYIGTKEMTLNDVR